MTARSRPPAARPHRGTRAAVLLVGGGALLLAVAAGRPPAFAWLPLLVGACLAVLTTLERRDGAARGAAAVLIGCGVLLLLERTGSLGAGVGRGAAVAVGAGAGLLGLRVLAGRGAVEGVGGAGAAVLGMGLVLALAPGRPVLLEPTTWGVLLVLAGAADLLLFARDREVGRTGGPPRPRPRGGGGRVATDGRALEAGADRVGRRAATGGAPARRRRRTERESEVEDTREHARAHPG